jgi:hypothetical protein
MRERFFVEIEWPANAVDCRDDRCQNGGDGGDLHSTARKKPYKKGYRQEVAKVTQISLDTNARWLDRVLTVSQRG